MFRSEIQTKTVCFPVVVGYDTTQVDDEAEQETRASSDNRYRLLANTDFFCMFSRSLTSPQPRHTNNNDSRFYVATEWREKGGGPFTSPGFNHRTPPWIPYTLYYWSLQLVVELPVLILAEECGSDAGKGVRFKHAQPLFECIVEFDLAAAAVEKDTSSSGELVSSCFFGIQ